MPAALLDTNAVSDLMRDQPNVKARVAAHPDPVSTSVIVVGEIGFGLSRLPLGKKRAGLEARAQRILAALRIEPVTEPIAIAYGRLKASLESQGINADDNDLWIAATTLTCGYLVVSRDQVFSQVADLQVEDWSI
jgi:predicted nucleic acid-binding protein